MGYFAGYAYYADGTARRLRLQRAWGETKLAIEDHANDIKQFSIATHTLRMESYSKDPYSLVLELSDGRILYLKFLSDASVPTYSKPVNALMGWLLSDATREASVARVGMMDVYAHNKEYPPGARGAEEWPKKDSLKSLTAELPAEETKSP